MSTTHEYPTAQLLLERDAGWLICHCDDPEPVTLPVWGVLQCERCGRKALP